MSLCTYAYVYTCMHIYKERNYVYIYFMYREIAIIHACVCMWVPPLRQSEALKWVSNETHMNGSWNTQNESCHIEWVMTHVRISHGTRANGSWVTYGGDVSQHLHCGEHSSKSHQYRMVVTSPQHTCKCSVGINHTFASYDSFSCVPWLLHIYDMTHSYLWHDSFMCVTLHIHTCDMTHSLVSHDAFSCVPWLIHMCNMTHSYVWHAYYICVPLHIQTCGIHHSVVSRDPFYCVPWLIHMYDMTHSYVWRDYFIRIPLHVHMCDMTHSFVSHDSLSCVP